MKKIISIMLIITLLITFIIPKPLMATEEQADTNTQTSKYNAQKSIIKDGTVTVHGKKQSPIDTPTVFDAIGTILATVSSTIAAAVRGLLAIAAADGEIPTTFTIENLVSGNYGIFNNNFLNDKSNGISNDGIREQVREWYYAIRNLAIILGLLVLLYIGIRMAISTLADDKAKYKKMFTAWLQSFILIFLLHYLMIAAFAIQEVLMKILMDIMEAVVGENGGAEETIASTCWIGIMKLNGLNIIWYAILYWVLTYYQIKFFFLYAKRMISTAFLIVIAPLITVTYSIDKVKDNKAQAFSAWIKEFLVNVFIQPVHLVIYLVFIVSASELAVVVPLFTMVFFGALSRGEKIVKGLFGMRGMKSISSLGKGKKK